MQKGYLIFVMVGLVLGASSSAHADTDPNLQGKLLARSDGAYFVYRDGYKMPIDLADIGDDAINAIADGPPPLAPATVAMEPTPTSAQQIKPGDLLYQADWSAGMNAWVGSKDFKTVSGMLVSDASLMWTPSFATGKMHASELWFHVQF